MCLPSGNGRGNLDFWKILGLFFNHVTPTSSIEIKHRTTPVTVLI